MGKYDSLKDKGELSDEELDNMMMECRESLDIWMREQLQNTNGRALLVFGVMAAALTAGWSQILGKEDASNVFREIAKRTKHGDFPDHLGMIKVIEDDDDDGTPPTIH